MSSSNLDDATDMESVNASDQPLPPPKWMYNLWQVTSALPAKAAAQTSHLASAVAAQALAFGDAANSSFSIISQAYGLVTLKLILAFVAGAWAVLNDRQGPYRFGLAGRMALASNQSDDVDDGDSGSSGDGADGRGQPKGTGSPGCGRHRSLSGLCSVACVAAGVLLDRTMLRSIGRFGGDPGVKMPRPALSAAVPTSHRRLISQRALSIGRRPPPRRAQLMHEAP